MADGLDMRVTCKAIRNAAIGKGFITYSNLAKAHGEDIDDVFPPPDCAAERASQNLLSRMDGLHCP